MKVVEIDNEEEPNEQIDVSSLKIKYLNEGMVSLKR